MRVKDLLKWFLQERGGDTSVEELLLRDMKGDTTPLQLVEVEEDRVIIGEEEALPQHGMWLLYRHVKDGYWLYTEKSAIRMALFEWYPDKQSALEAYCDANARGAQERAFLMHSEMGVLSRMTMLKCDEEENAIK